MFKPFIFSFFLNDIFKTFQNVIHTLTNEKNCETQLYTKNSQLLYEKGIEEIHVLSKIE